MMPSIVKGTVRLLTCIHFPQVAILGILGGCSVFERCVCSDLYVLEAAVDSKGHVRDVSLIISRKIQ